jgi:hypothetical protein
MLRNSPSAPARNAAGVAALRARKPGFLSVRAPSVRWARCCCLARCLCVLNHPTDCCRTAASRLPRRCVLSARGRKSLRALRWRPPPQRWPALASAPKPADGARCPARLALPAAASVPPRAGARPVPGAVRPWLRAAEPAPWRGPVCAPHGLPCALTSVASSAPPPQTDEAAAAPVHLRVDLRGQGARWCCCPLLLPVPLPPPPPAPAAAASPSSEVPRRSAKRLFTLTPLVACAARCCAACLPPSGSYPWPPGACAWLSAAVPVGSWWLLPSLPPLCCSVRPRLGALAPTKGRHTRTGPAPAPCLSG